MIKFTYNKAYKYVTNTHPFDIFMDLVMTGLGTIAFGGIITMIYHIANGAPGNFGIYLYDRINTNNNFSNIILLLY